MPLWRCWPRIAHSPFNEDSHFVFTTQSKNTLYLHFEAALFRDPEDEMRFSYPADHPLAGEFKDQTIALEREYVKTSTCLCTTLTNQGKKNAQDGCALALLSAMKTALGEIIVL